ncbi:hypothetical protein JL100_024210 [Skermanella mucosa]|uniref:DUF6916 family protein n=1 Tax=Skermanella mucosa TaxID=1789672 RepID=UPI00192C62D3|nr:hypothetical protein [Skermanella mucosa]UEM24175.1 hypothetical protein JL100_024210 [Skermanella mucosa]
MTESAAAPVAAPAAVPAADIFTLEVFTPWIGKEFSILHPNVSADFKLRLTNVYDPSKGASHPRFRKPLTLQFRGPADPILLEGFYDIEAEGTGVLGLHIVPTLTPDREENGMGYHVAFN